MSVQWSTLAIYFGLLLHSGALLFVNGSCEKQVEQVKADCQAYQRKVMISLREIFEDQKQCSPCPKCKDGPTFGLRPTTAEIERTQRNFQLLAEATLTTPSQEVSPRVAQPDVTVRLNDPVQFSCLPRRENMTLCLWQKNINGNGQMIVMDKELVQQGGRTDVGGGEYIAGGLHDGKCDLKISSVKKDDLGQWSCSVVTTGRIIIGGNVNVVEKEIPVYFATGADGIKAYYPKTMKVTKVVDTTDDVLGVAYDTATNRLYWTSGFESNKSSKIYRYKVDEGDGSVEMLLSTSKYGFLRGMDFDWIAQNLYVVSSQGFILACDGRVNRSFRCDPVLRGQGSVVGIALDPNEGTMYYTSWSDSQRRASVLKSGTDGSDASTLVTNLKCSSGLAIDFSSSRLYWANCKANKTQSSWLHGGGVVTVAELPSGPYGITLLDQRLYWSLPDEKALQSSNKAGSDNRTVYEGTARIRHLVAPDWTVPRKRTNPCREKACPGVCVLTESSYKCL